MGEGHNKEMEGVLTSRCREAEAKRGSLADIGIGGARITTSLA